MSNGKHSIVDPPVHASIDVDELLKRLKLDITPDIRDTLSQVIRDAANATEALQRDFDHKVAMVIKAEMVDVKKELKTELKSELKKELQDDLHAYIAQELDGDHLTAKVRRIVKGKEGKKAKRALKKALESMEPKQSFGDRAATAALWTGGALVAGAGIITVNRMMKN